MSAFAAEIGVMARCARVGGSLLLALSLGVAGTVALASPANAEGKTDYTSTQTIPVPPASSYQGSGGGDGWDVVMTPEAVYNVFHHSGSFTLACHKQSDATSCWSPKTIRDASGNDFGGPGASGLHLDQATGKIFGFTTRGSDLSAGVICADTTLPADEPDLFCGYTTLAPAGEASNASGFGAMSNPVTVGNRIYAFNYFNGQGQAGARNTLLCFDVVTKSPCPSQPYAFDGGEGTYSNSSFPPPAIAAIGSRIVVPVTVGGVARLACFDTATGAECTGTWPIAIVANYPSGDGSAFPTTNESGVITGVCLPTSGIPCFSLSGAAEATPAGLAGVITPNEPWNGPAVVIGPRVYLANGSVNQVQCFNFASGATCDGFPKSPPNLGYLYTVNPDPARPSCLWLNADNGSGQLQNFDAYTGGPCGEGSLRVLASTIVVPTELCTPNDYQKLQIVSPERASYTSATVHFLGGDGTPIEGIDPRPLDATGAVDLRGLPLNTDTGLPQFLIDVVGATGDPGAVTVQLSWEASNDDSCRPARAVTLEPRRAVQGTSFTAKYTCDTVASLAVNKADGTPATGVRIGLATSGNGTDYVQGVILDDPGNYLLSVTCNGARAESPLVEVTEEVANTFGPGWPSGGQDFTLNYDYGGDHRYLGNVVQGAANWTNAGTPVRIATWPGVPAKLHLTVRDINVDDDYWGYTAFTNDCRDDSTAPGSSCSYTHNYVFLNQRTLDPETDAIRTKVAGHEFGHALALRHPTEAGLNRNDGPTSLMWQGRLPYNTPQDYDIDRVNGLYR